MADHKLDCKGLKCPLPIVEVFKKFKTMSVGDTLEVSSDDLAFPHDIEAWSRKMGQQVLGIEDEGGLIVAHIKKVQ
jgi:tRNA 2-thiouridine synthesizing protein A